MPGKMNQDRITLLLLPRSTFKALNAHWTQLSFLHGNGDIGKVLFISLLYQEKILCVQPLERVAL